MKSSGFFLLGVATGVLGTLLYKRLIEEAAPEDAERVSKRVSNYLQELEERLEQNIAAARG